MKSRKETGGTVDSRDIKKHKKDILRIAAELMLREISDLPESVHSDIKEFICTLNEEPFDAELLADYGLKNNDVLDLLKRVFE